MKNKFYPKSSSASASPFIDLKIVLKLVFVPTYHSKSDLLHVQSECKSPLFPCQAWEDTFRNWDAVTRYLETYPKLKLEEGKDLTDVMRITKRKTPHSSTEHELEVSFGYCSKLNSHS